MRAKKNEKCIIDALNNGKTIKETAALCDVTLLTATNTAKRHGIDYKVKKKPLLSIRIPPDIWAKIEKGMEVTKMSRTDFICKVFDSLFYNSGEYPERWKHSQKDCQCTELMKPDTTLNQCPDCGFYLPF